MTVKGHDVTVGAESSEEKRPCLRNADMARRGSRQRELVIFSERKRDLIQRIQRAAAKDFLAVCFNPNRPPKRAAIKLDDSCFGVRQREGKLHSHPSTMSRRPAPTGTLSLRTGS